MRPALLLLLVLPAVTARAQAPTATPSTATWGVMLGSRRVNGYGSGSDVYGSLVFQRPIGTSRHAIRVEIARDAQSRRWSYAPTCADCFQASAFDATSYGAVVNWVYERRQGHRVRPYVYFGTGVFAGRSSFRLLECPVSACQSIPFQEPREGRGVGAGTAGGLGVLVSWRAVQLTAEYRTSFIAGEGASGGNGFVFGLRKR